MSSKSPHRNKVSHFIEITALDPESYLYTLGILRRKNLSSQVSWKIAKY